MSNNCVECSAASGFCSLFVDEIDEKICDCCAHHKGKHSRRPVTADVALAVASPPPVVRCIELIRDHLRNFTIPYLCAEPETRAPGGRYARMACRRAPFLASDARYE